MIHIKQIRINCNKKLYKRSPINLFARNEEELDKILEARQKKFLSEKFPNGIPEDDQFSRTPFCTTDSTHVTIPDKEFLHYLAIELKMKSIKEKYIKLVQS